MGCFSWGCGHCGKSILNSYVVGEGADGTIDPTWNEATLVTEDSVVTGSYDGYGRIDSKGGLEVDITELDTVKLYHKLCYAKAGKPSYPEAKLSCGSADQGHFVRAEDYQGVPGGA